MVDRRQLQQYGAGYGFNVRSFDVEHSEWGQRYYPAHGERRSPCRCVDRRQRWFERHSDHRRRGVDPDHAVQHVHELLGEWDQHRHGIQWRNAEHRVLDHIQRRRLNLQRHRDRRRFGLEYRQFHHAAAQRGARAGYRVRRQRHADRRQWRHGQCQFDRRPSGDRWIRRQHWHAQHRRRQWKPSCGAWHAQRYYRNFRDIRARPADRQLQSHLE